MVELESSLEEDSCGKQELWGIIEGVKKAPKKEGISCRFCEERMGLLTVKDYVSNYSSIIYCIVNHCGGHVELPVKDLFKIEMFILNLLVDPENLNIYKALKGAYNQFEGIRKTIGILSEEFYSNSVNLIECEHEIESLTLMVYQRNEKMFDKNDIEYLLTLLYLRKEYTRFFRVLNKTTPSIYELRLALSLTLNGDCDITTRSIVDKFFSRAKENSYTGLKGEENDQLLQDIVSIVDLNKPNTLEWLNEAKINFEWCEKVRIWFKNRSICEGSVDRPMLDEAIKSKRWDDGWYIYKLGSKKVKEDYLKVYCLCVKAIIHDKDELWVSRLLDVVEAVVVSKEIEVCCDIIDGLFEKIEEIDERFKNTILSEFIRKISRVEEDERVVNHLIEVICALTKTCNGTEACAMCVDHVATIYREWKKNNTGGFFFKHHSKYESQIFENMMELYCTIEDPHKFVGVCRDLVENEGKLNREMVRCVKSVHEKTCSRCPSPSITRSMNQNGGEELLSHLFSHYSSVNE